MQFRRRFLMWLVLGAFFMLSVSPILAAEFSATVLTKAGGQEMPGKIYVKGDKMRNEFQAGGQTNISILRPDKNLVWVIIPQQKAYMEMPSSEEQQQKILANLAKYKAKMKLVGVETVNGYECDKYETTMSQQGQSLKQFIWISKKMGIPIKMVSADGSLSVEYQDIKSEQVADSLFEPPKGYRKMQMPFPMPSMK